MSKYQQNNLFEKAKITPELAKRNLDSWENVIVFYKKFSMPRWEWLTPLIKLVEQITESEYAQLFRGGQSIYHLLISTKEHHGLEEDDHFVGVYIEKNRPLWIEYRAGYEIAARQTCDDDFDVWEVVKTFLERLWYETKGKDRTEGAN